MNEHDFLRLYGMGDVPATSSTGAAPEHRFRRTVPVEIVLPQTFLPSHFFSHTYRYNTNTQTHTHIYLGPSSAHPTWAERIL
ncbi:hypothetical protein Hanom_Chr07g00623361 [Helianthus anomalus]